MTSTIIPEDRFWSKVDKTDKCWMWTAACSSDGYGNISIKGKTYKPHRVSYEIKHGPIPKGMLICHHCDNKLCVRPSHLFLGTQKDNMQDAVGKGRAARGERHGSSKLTESQVKQIRIDPRMEKEIAPDYSISNSVVGKIKRRVNWKHIK